MTQAQLAEQARAFGFTSLGVVAYEANGAQLLDAGNARHLAVIGRVQPRSLLILAMPWQPIRWPETLAEISGYYIISNQAYRAATAFAAWLEQQGSRAAAMPFLRLKPLAQQAGLGCVRRNTLLYTADHGSMAALQAIGVDLALTPSAPQTAEACGSCARCVNACPTGALDRAGGFNRERCLRQHMLSGQVIPEGYRSLMGKRLLGCELCQWACPHQRPLPHIDCPELELFNIETLLDAAPETLARLGALIGPNEARKRRIQLQAAIIAGNMRAQSALPKLHALAVQGDAALAEHARWAIERMT